MRIRDVIWGVIVALIGGLAWSTGTAAAQPGDVASLTPMQGLVQRQQARDPAADWRTVTQPELVQEGSMVRTDGQGLAILTFFEGVETEILPDSVVEVGRLRVEALAEGGPFEISLAVMAGDALHHVNAVMDAESRYEVRTPSAVIVVRGTEFWTSVTPQGATTVRVLDGLVSVTGVDAEGQMTQTVMLEAGTTVTAGPSGELGDVTEIRDLPPRPANTALAAETCGNGVCEAAEAEGCPLDCRELPGCGDGECDAGAGEDALLCAADCALPLVMVEPFAALGDTVYLHFFWGEMRCDLDPAVRVVTAPVVMHWGVGCFDSAAHASAHPHPADYQLIVDGQPWPMGSLTQSGPNLHNPYCPWGWNYALGPVTLPPGHHTLTLVETLTDTWSGESGSRDAGTVSRLTCELEVGAPGGGR